MKDISNHEFINVSIPKELENLFRSDVKCFICNKCQLLIVKGNSMWDHFYLNNEEVFPSFISIYDINLTCEEFQIKSILE